MSTVSELKPRDGDHCPPWKRPAVRNVLIVALLAELAYALLNISAMPVYLANDRGFPAGAIGMIIGAFLLTEALLKGPMGSLADRVGRKRLIVIGPIITIFTSIASLYVPRDWDYETVAFLTLRAMDGVGVAMVWPAAFALIGESVKESQKQEAMSLLNMCYLGGIALALFVGGVVDDVFGSVTAARIDSYHAPSLYLSAVLCSFVAAFAYFKLPSGRGMREAARQERAVSGRAAFKFTDIFATAKRIPGFLILGAVTFMGIGFPIAIVKLFAQDQLELSGTKFGILVMPALIAMAALSPIMSRYGERLGRQRAVHIGLFLCSLGMSAIAAGAFVPQLRSVLVVALGTVPVALGFILAVPAWYAAVSEIDRKRRAANIGAVMTAQGLGAIVGSQFGSQAYERLQDVELFGMHLDSAFGRYSPFIGCAICIIIGWLLSLRLLRTGPQPDARSVE